MNTSVVTQPLAKIETPLLAVAVAQGADLPASLGDLDQAAGGALRRAHADFRGKRDETQMIHPGGGAARRILLVGMGKPADVSRNAIRRAAAVAARKARGIGAEAFAFAVAHEARGGVGARDVGQVVAEGAAHGAWSFTSLKRPPEEPKPELGACAIVVDEKEKKDAEAGRVIGDAIAAGHHVASDQQIQPGHVYTPRYLAEQAQQLAARHGIACTVLDKAQITKEGMGALLAVAQGSVEEPRFIVLEYKGGGSAAPVAIIGKGVTFDSGGISIKPAQNMEEMKYDMSGAAAVLGTFEVLGRLKPKINVVGLVPATENLPSGTAVKPGDVIKSHFGKTIEIVNTDAEGRLILCDALSYVRRFKPAAVIDAATLTGAVTIALGHAATGVMGNDDALVAEVQAAGERAGERAWPLPLWDDYRDLLKSDIADVKNTGGRAAGTITGGWFLREFVDGFPWVHLDIAGTAYTESDSPPQPRGPTGIGVRLFTELLLRRAGS